MERAVEVHSAPPLNGMEPHEFHAAFAAVARSVFTYDKYDATSPRHARETGFICYARRALAAPCERRRTHARSNLCVHPHG